LEALAGAVWAVAAVALDGLVCGVLSVETTSFDTLDREVPPLAAAAALARAGFLRGLCAGAAPPLSAGR